MVGKNTRYSSIDLWKDLPDAIKALPIHEDDTTFMYKRGCLKTSLYNSTEGMPDSYACLFDEWREKYNIYDAQLFTSLSFDKMLGWHTDYGNVILSPVYGSALFQVRDSKDPQSTCSLFEVQEGETLFIPAFKEHCGLGSLYPRIVFSCSTIRDLSPDEVDYHYSEITGDWEKELEQTETKLYTLTEFYGRGFKAYRWVNEEGQHVGPNYFSTPEKAMEWRDQQDETN